MATAYRFEDLDAWKSARSLTREVYAASRDGSFSRDYALRDQIRRAAISVMSNIAEGFESRTQPLFAEYLGRAKASCGELRAQCYVALDAGYLPDESFTSLLSQAEICIRQIARLLQYVQAHPDSLRFRESQSGYGMGDLKVES